MNEEIQELKKEIEDARAQSGEKAAMSLKDFVWEDEISEHDGKLGRAGYAYDQHGNRVPIFVEADVFMLPAETATKQ